MAKHEQSNSILSASKNRQTEVLDPIQQAAQEQLAAAAAAVDIPQAAEGEDRGIIPPADVATEQVKVQDTATPGVEEAAAPAPEVKEEPLPHVQEVGRKPVQPVVVSSILSGGKKRPAAPLQPQVDRASGASAREASPEGEAQGQTHIQSNSFSALISKQKQSGTASAMNLIAFLETYVDVMAPRRITSIAQVVQQQEGLLDALVNVIERAPAKEFARLWNIAVLFMSEYKNGCFSPAYYSRGARDWKRDPVKFTMLTNLLNLLQATAADPETVHQTVNVNTVFGTGFSEDARQRAFTFYAK